MKTGTWIRELPVSITVCDTDGIIVEANEQAFRNYGKIAGESLIGKNIFDCHPAEAREKLAEMMAHQKTQVNFTKKDDQRKMFYQTPWFDNGIFKGLVEISFPLPAEIPTYERK